MISVLVRVTSGHYRMPGQVEQGGTQTSAPIAPPSCIRGFLESLVGERSGSFRGSFAYGYAEPPRGHGFLLRRAHVLRSYSKVKGEPTGSGIEGIRTVSVETYLDLSYRILVRGDWETRVLAALAGDVERFGVLSLGESQDLVVWIEKVPIETPARWVIPGTMMTLITASGRGFDRISAKYGTFDFGPEPAWFNNPVTLKENA